MTSATPSARILVVEDDQDIADVLIDYLRHAGYRMAQLLMAHDIASAGTPLFRWWPEAEPEALHAHMAARGIWCRLFPDAARGIRVGLPGLESDWQRLEQALHEWSNG